MRVRVTAALVCLLLSQQAAARQPLSSEGRAAFRKAVDEYQLFVVPHCAPDEVQAYVTARADRDHAFVRSLHGTPLKQDYEKAVADRAARDRHTVYECFGPPPPPPPPPGWTPPEPAPVQPAPKPRDTFAEHFAGGDRYFEEMVQLRDSLIGPAG
ncbi:hypothetical protein [Sphingomonas molluscorum]|uniref:hypothetical protein n=1 Tax=Sphingomonas molluscorum TaxID=418184 RepID=UPI0031DFEB07